MKIGEKILQVIDAKKLRKSKISEELGVSRQTLDNWISGATNPGTDDIARLSKILGIQAAELMSENPLSLSEMIEANPDYWLIPKSVYYALERSMNLNDGMYKEMITSKNEYIQMLKDEIKRLRGDLSLSAS